MSRKHHFVQMMAYTFIIAQDTDAAEAVKEFQAFIRELEPAKASLLFEKARGPMDQNSFNLVLKFAHGYRDRIGSAHPDEVAAGDGPNRPADRLASCLAPPRTASPGTALSAAAC